MLYMIEKEHQTNKRNVIENKNKKNLWQSTVPLHFHQIIHSMKW